MTEILAPAGNFQKLKTAIFYGADSVYLSGQNYGLRRGADNFSMEELKNAVRYAHQRNCKVYVTANSFFHDEDYEEFGEYLDYLAEISIDALICSDLGVADAVFQKGKIPVHVSTQAGVLNSFSAELWKSLGAKRIVTGREISIAEAAKIKERVGIEVEIFIHGAMCMSYSGNCTISNYTAGRDSNRGGCIQSCRHLYRLDSTDEKESKDAFFMSSKDLNGHSMVAEAYRQKIDSLKIEGRMKSLLYVASVTRAYANLLKSAKQKNSDSLHFWESELKKLPYRGYTEGSLREKAGKDSVYGGTQDRVKDYFLGGMVLDRPEEHRIVFQAFNKITRGSVIEWLDTDEKIYRQKFVEARNTRNQPLTEIHSNQIVFLETEFPLRENMIARISPSTET